MPPQWASGNQRPPGSQTDGTTIDFHNLSISFAMSFFLSILVYLYLSLNHNEFLAS